MFASAAWSLSLLWNPTARLDVARWWSFANVMGFSAVIAVASIGRGRGSRGRASDLACVLIELSVLIAWLQLTGSLSSYLIGLPALLIATHRRSGGPRIGLIAWLFVSVLHIGVVCLEAAGKLAYAPIYAPELATNAAKGSIAAPVIGLLVTYGAALLLGGTSSSAARERATGGFAGSEGREIERVLLDRYRVLRLIGSGETGSVYEAKRLEDDARVAIKIFHRALAAIPRARDQFRHDLELSRRLPPGRIVRVLDHDVSDQARYVVMEHLEGENLATRLARRRRLSLTETLELAAQLADVLDRAAELGIVHRDIEPRNVLLVGKNDGIDVRLLDFGFSHLRATPLSGASAVPHVGTPGFQAPEQVATGLGDIGPHTDVFALGAVVYRALSGRDAFPSRKPAAAVYEAMNHHPPALSGVAAELPSQLDAVLALALAKKTDQRYARACEFVRDLRAARDGNLAKETLARAAALSAGPGTHTATFAA